jgi:polar amino acid transport system permease protein
MNYEWDYRFLVAYAPAIINGALVTLQLAAIAIVGGTALGLAVAALRSSRYRTLRWLTIIYIETGLALPLLVLLIWMSYCLPQISRRLTFSNYTVAAVALVVNLAPFVAETLRSGFATLPEDYYLAARAVGMTELQAFRRVTFPLALRRTLPGLIAHYVTTLKLVSICSVIAVPEIVHTSSTIISREFRPLEVYTTMGLAYLVMILPFTILARGLERRYQVRN